MKRIIFILLVLAGMIATADTWADEKQEDKKKKPVPIPVYFGNSSITGGEVPILAFDSLLKQGFTAKDSVGRPYIVNSFFLTYCERKLYEDSVGNPMILTDYLSEYCFSNTLKEYQLNAILERAKRGDTLIIEQVKLTSADTAKLPAQGKPMKLVIGR